MIKLIAPLLLSFSAMAAPNMVIHAADDNKVFACNTQRALNYTQRLIMGEPLTQIQKAEINNTCYPFDSETLVTAFDIGVTAQIEVLVLDKLQLLYINSRDLKGIK